MQIRNMATHALGTIVAVAGLAIGSAPPASAQQYEIAGSDVAVFNLAGEVSIRRGSGSSVVVEVELGGRDADRLTVETGRIDGRETLRIIYPSDRISYSEMRHGETTLRVHADGTFGDHDDWRRNRGDRVTISGRGDGFEAHANLTLLVPAGQTIAMYLGVGRATVTDVDGDLRVDVSSGPVESRGTRGSLIVDTGSGSVDVRDADGDVNVDTGSGNVEVDDVRGPSLTVDTGSGSVGATNVNVAQLNIDTGSGQIRAHRVTSADVMLDTGSGSVELELLEDADQIVIDTGSGSVTLMVPESFGATVELETGSGGIDLEMPLTVRRWERDHVRGTMGDGRGRLIIDTGSGSIHIRHTS